MSFYGDWLAGAMHTVREGSINLPKAIAKGLDPETAKGALRELETTRRTIQAMINSKIIKIPDHQLNEFVRIPINQDQDWNLLRSPFPSIYFDVTPPLTLPEYWDTIDEKHHTEARIMAFMISEVIVQNPELNVPRAWRLTVFVPVDHAKENIFIVTFGITADGKLARSDYGLGSENADLQHKSFMHMAIHVMNYLTSPSIILEKHSPDPKLQKVREKRNKPVLPDWYEITYRKVHREVANPGTGVGGKHSFRYDVRGHFMYPKKGKLAGRAIWIPDHQRGLSHDTYKPKIYVTKP